ncbi:MAG: MBL fold metallo-hydrolase, partial [Proteobacteria bacterium]|nr:MBL fold metallo-hydrolase [Pseudomonadota bacterium]
MDWIKFLGTAGARFVVSKQLRSSGGIWMSLAGQEILIDPGPGTLVHCLKSHPKLDPGKLDAIILTHKHLDHSGDVNVMIEAMTEGRLRKRGVIFAPADAFENDPVIFSYLKDYPEKIEILKEKKEYRLGDLTIKTPVKHIHHGVESYGLNLEGGKKSVSLIADTRYFEGIESFYPGEILILYVVLFQPFPDRVIDHLNLDDAEKIIQANRPMLTLLTHFGLTMLRSKPWKLAEALSQKLKVKVQAARDGMSIEL